MHLYKIKETVDNEQGITLVEIMVAFAIVLGVVIATGTVLVTLFASQASLEAKDKATQIAQSVLNQTSQASWQELGFKQSDINAAAPNGLAGATKNPATNEKIVVRDSSVNSMQAEFVPYRQVVVGQNTFTVQLWFTWAPLNPTTAQGQGAVKPPNTVATNALPNIRVTVIVMWKTASGDQQLTLSQVRTAGISECAPPVTSPAGTRPTWCTPPS